MRKLSEILIEIAKVGYKNKKYHQSERIHILMFLAHIAWNRVTLSPDYCEGDQLLDLIYKMPYNAYKIKEELISNDWEKIISKMIRYKKAHFSDDMRKITLCGYTERETLRVEWEY